MLKTLTLLTRRPLITQSLSPFAESYYIYHSQNRQGQSRTVIKDFWTKKGSGATQAIETSQGAPRQTLADLNKDFKSLDRHLDQSLFLLVKQAHWTLPNGLVLDNEALHESAYRNVIESTGNSAKFWIVGKAPIGLLNAPQSPNTKIFIYKAHILSGQYIPVSSKGIEDFVWVTKSEAANYLDNDMYTDLVNLL